MSIFLVQKLYLFHLVHSQKKKKSCIEAQARLTMQPFKFGGVEYAGNRIPLVQRASNDLLRVSPTVGEGPSLSNPQNPARWHPRSPSSRWARVLFQRPRQDEGPAVAHFVFLFPVDAQNGIYVLTVDERETISSTEVDRGAFHPFRSPPSSISTTAVFILPRGQTTGINTLLLGVLPFVECMTLSRIENHSFNVQAARP